MSPRAILPQPSPALPAAAVLAAALLSIPALAQEGDSGEPPAVSAKLTVSQQLAVENGDVIGITPIDLSYSSGTRSQRLEFSLSLPLREGDPEDDSFIALDDRRARLYYTRFTRNAAIEAELSHYETSLDREIFFDEDNEVFVTYDNGTVADSALRLGYAFGSQAKLGGEFGLSWRQRDYSGTTDPDLYDVTTLSGNATIFLEPTPLIRARILASGSRGDSDGQGTDTRSSRVGLGASLQVDKVTNLDTELAWSDIRREEVTTGDVDRAQGLSFRLGATRSRPTGDWTLRLASDPGTSGRRDSLTLGRSLEMRSYTLSALVGATRFAGNIDPIYTIGYERDLGPLAALTASLDQRASTDADGDEALNTSIALGYRRQLTELSSLSSSVRYRATTGQTAGVSDAETIAFNLDYSHNLAQDFALVAGVSVIRASGENSDPEDDDERIYLGLSRSFDFLP